MNAFVRSVVVLILLIAASACKNGEREVYEQGGFSVTLPQGWEVGYDTSESLVSDREVSIKTGDYSYLGFYLYLDPAAYPKNRLAFSDLLDNYLTLNFSENSGPENISVTRESITRGGFSGQRLIIETNAMVTLEAFLEVYLLDFHQARILVVFNSNKEAAEQVDKHIQKALESGALGGKS